MRRHNDRNLGFELPRQGQGVDGVEFGPRLGEVDRPDHRGGPCADGPRTLVLEAAPTLFLEVLQVAEPCRPFSGWALGGVVEAQVLKETLQFLEGGTRGYYCRGLSAGIVSVGDRVALP